MRVRRRRRRLRSNDAPERPGDPDMSRRSTSPWLFLLASLALGGCVWSLAQPEFKRCGSADWPDREAIGLHGHVTPGMSIEEFLAVFEALSS